MGLRAAGRSGNGRYSGLALLRHGLLGRGWQPVWTRPSLGSAYDAVVVGGGVHGLSTAYHLAARHGITRVAVIERSYIGSGGTGRNTAIVRANYLTPEGIAFYSRSLALYERMTEELNFNILFEPRGHLTLGHDDGTMRTLRWRAEINKALGVASELLDPEACQKLVPALDISSTAAHPILGGLWHPPGGTIRHDAVVWAYARAAARLGVEIHQETEVEAIDVVDGRVRGVRTSRGPIATPLVIDCAAGWSNLVATMAGVQLPITTVPLQAAVSEPVRPFLDPILASSNLHVYISQTIRGEIVFGGAVDAFPSWSTRGSLEFLEQIAEHVLELLPNLTHLRILRQWAGICDMTPDAAPIIGRTPVEGFLVDAGWGSYGMKAGPAAGEAIAELVASGRGPELIAPFALDRFERGRLVNEKGATAVGH
jgi:sarcosine oxidase subunit beta